MSSDMRRGVNYEVGPNRASFFGVEGMMMDGTPRYKGLQIDSGGFLGGLLAAFADNMFVPVHGNVDPMPVIRECIANDIANGNGDDIAQILLSPASAVTLCLMGVLTPDHFADGNVTEGPDFIDVLGIQIDDRVLTMRVLRNPEHSVATADAAGNMIP